MKKASYFEFIKHAISTPLSTILIDSQLALEKNNDQKFKEILLSATQIKNLLEKDQFKEKRRLFSLNSALTEIIFLNQCLHKEVSYAKKLQQTASLQINGNRLLFQEIVACLLNNAVEAYQNKDLNKVILIKSQIKNNLLEIAIADGGCGLNSWQKFLAGNKFYSLKESHSGIGLFYVKRILKKSFQGRLKLISKKNHGSTAILEIPLICHLK